MEETLETSVVLSLEVSGRKIVNTHPSDSNLYEVFDSFIGACVSVGYPVEMINGVIEEYIDNVKQQKEDAQTS